MLKTPVLLLFATCSFVVVLCSDDKNSASVKDVWGYEPNFEDASCDETQYDDYIVCDPNEEYSDCVNGGCKRRECADLRRPEVCIDPACGYCMEGCVCKNGYLRNSECDCVPINDCPERSNKKCRGLNEYYENCAASSKATEGKACNVGCRCVIGYVRRKGKCVPNRGQCTTTTPKPTTTPKNSSLNTLDEILEANKRFTGKFVQLKIEESQESFIASPFSVLFPLGQIAPFAKGTTYNELLKFLNLNDRTEIQGAFRSLLNDLNSPKNVTLLLGQKAYANKQFELNPKFINDSKRYFDSEPQNLDFSRSQEAADIINDWVKKLTNGLIPNLVEASMLGALTRLVLVNAIYFKGNWLRPFDPKRTQKRDFYVTVNKTVSVDMMYQEGSFGYTENSQYKALQLFYKDNDFSLLTVLPTSSDNYSLKGLVSLFDDSDAISKIIKDLRSERVQVYLPSIKTSTKTDLKKILQQYNVTEVFNPQTADISDLLKQPQQLFISEFIQKAVIIINELGSEAAAANAAVIKALAVIVSQSKVFEANRPYYYFILYKDNVLFCGANTGM